MTSLRTPPPLQTSDAPCARQARAVYVVDDDSAIRRSLVYFLSAAGFEARPYLSGVDFIDDAARIRAGCALVDLRMSELDGIQTIEALGPLLSKLPVVVMTGHGDVATAVRAMKLGASDFLEKPFEEDVLLETLRRVFERLDEQAVATGDRDAAKTVMEALTQRETDVLRGLASGLSNKELAYRLDLSVRTVEMHRANMMDRLGVHTLADALRIAFHGGLDSAEMVHALE